MNEATILGMEDPGELFNFVRNISRRAYNCDQLMHVAFNEVRSAAHACVSCAMTLFSVSAVFYFLRLLFLFSVRRFLFLFCVFCFLFSVNICFSAASVLGVLFHTCPCRQIKHFPMSRIEKLRQQIMPVVEQEMAAFFEMKKQSR